MFFGLFSNKISLIRTKMLEFLIFGREYLVKLGGSIWVGNFHVLLGTHQK